MRTPQIPLLSSIKTHWHILVLLLITLSLLVSHTLYVQKTYQHAKWDEHLFLDQGLGFYDLLKNPTPENLSKMGKIQEQRQPLYALSIALTLLVVGADNTYKTALWLNVLFYISTTIAIYYMGRAFLSKTASLLASFLFATYGFPLFYLHFAYSETATTTFVTLSLLFLVYTRGFSNTKNTILFSLCFALGSLTRWVTPLFIAAPFVVSFVKGIKNLFITKTSIKRFGLHFTIVFFIGVLLPVFLYYIPSRDAFSIYLSSNIHNAPDWVSQLNYLSPELRNTFSVRSIMFYFNILSQQTVYLFLLFGIGVIIGIIFWRKYLFLLVGFFSIYAFFTFGSVLKDDRYIVPLYPLMALISAIPFEYVKGKLKIPLIGITIFIGILNFIGASWGLGPMGQQGLKDIVLPEFIHHPRRIYLTPMVWPPVRNITSANKIALVIEKHSQGDPKPASVLNTYSYHPLELDSALYTQANYKTRGKLAFNTLRAIPRGEYRVLFDLLTKADYLIVKDTKNIDESKYPDKTMDMMVIVFNKALERKHGKLPDAFKPIDKIFYPLDSLNLIVYKKTRRITSTELQEFAELLGEVDPSYKKNIDEAIANFK